MATAKKGIKKEFYDVSAPMTSTKISLYASSEEELIGKVVILDLTRNLRGKSFVVKLKVGKDNEGLIGIPFDLQLEGSYVRRMMRKGADYVEDSFETECKDGKARMKTFFITRNKVSRLIRNKIRETAKNYLQGYTKSRNVQEIFTEVMTNKIQKDLSLKLKKVYPLALCEIRVFSI